MNIEIVKADVTTLDADAIQNAANGLLIHGAGVAGAIRKAGAPYVQAESTALVRMNGRVPLTNAVFTSAGDMPARYVIHAVTMDEPGGTTSWAVAHAATLHTLFVAELLKVESLALVALGTGIGGLTLDACADAMLKAIWWKRAYRSVRTITFALFDDTAVDVFEAVQRRLDGRG
jgi:O-acetyl-ADP-ribose deacetylase (regulator of RNase III)